MEVIKTPIDGLVDIRKGSSKGEAREMEGRRKGHAIAGHVPILCYIN